MRKENQPKAEPPNLGVENSVFSGYCLRQPRKQQELNAARVRDGDAAGQVLIGDIVYGTMLKYQPSKMQGIRRTFYSGMISIAQMEG